MPVVPVGSTNLAAAGVPNVLVQIVPPNPLLNGVPTDIVGVVGIASWGPVNSPQVIGSLPQQVAIFGNPLSQQYDMGTQVYNAIQQGANNFRCVRVTDGTDVKAFTDLDDYLDVPQVVLTAIYSGTVGNSLNAVISQGSNNTPSAPTYKLSLFLSGGITEVFDGIGGTGNQFWTNLINAVNMGQSNLRGPSQLVTAASIASILSVSVVNAGSYATLPTLSTSGPGTGATLAPKMKAISASVAAGGTGYAVADTITLTGGTETTATILTVDTVQLESTIINAGGSGYAVGDTIILAGGTFTSQAVATVATVAAGVILTVTVASGGSYSVAPTTFTQGSSSGSGTGATFETNVFGANVVAVSTAGAYTVLPASPVAQGSTTGSGTGATFNVLWGLLSVTVSAAGSGFNLNSGLVVTGGNGSGGTGDLVLSSSNIPAAGTTTNYVFASGTNGNGNVTDATLIGSDTSTPRSGMFALRGTLASIGVLADQTNQSFWPQVTTFAGQEGIYFQNAFANIYANNIAGAVTAKQAVGVANYNMKILQGDWELIQDPFNNVARFTSPQGFTAGILATQLPSGSSLNKIMNGIVATQKSSLSQMYSNADLLQLQTGGIDVITNQLPVSPTSGVFGIRLGCNSSPSLTTNGDNYTRMINFLSQTFVAGLGAFIGLPQTPDLQAQAQATLQTYLQNLVTLGMIGTVDGSPAFQVILNSSNNPPMRVALGYMQADVQVTLFSIVQQFVINLQAGQSVQVQVLPAQLSA